LDLKNVPVPEAVHKIVSQAGLALGWSQSKVPLRGKVTVVLKDIPVDDALRKVLQGTGAVAKMSSDGETVMIVAEHAGAGQEEATGIVAGRVVDSANEEGVKGATVTVVGTKLSAVTSESGAFVLRNVPVGKQVLTVKLFGYKSESREVVVREQRQIAVRFVLTTTATMLSGVVTTATGKQRKLAVGNDITTLNVDSIQQVAPITSVTDLLETRVPGLTVLHSSGTPGAPSRIRLRGASSITGNNDPIVIVDGVRVYASQSDKRNNLLADSRYNGQSMSVPGSSNSQGVSSYAAPSPLDQIDPSTIATIEVFKGPSASAMYGSDAANGVIVITTKHGRAGPTHWNLSVGQGVNWIPGSWPVNYYRFGRNSVDWRPGGGPANGMCNFGDIRCTPDSIVAFQALNDPRYTVFSHGNNQTSALTVSGGSSELQYSLTGSAAKDVGNLKLPAIEAQRYEQFYGPIPHWMLRPDRYQTWGVDGSLTAQPYSTLRVTLQSGLYNSHQQQGSLQQAISQLQGEYINGAAILDLGGASKSLVSTPLIEKDVERATADAVTTTNALTINWHPLSWLPITGTAGLNTIHRIDETYIPYGVYAGGPGAGIVGSGVNAGDTTGSYGLGRGTSQDKTLALRTDIPTLRDRLRLGIGGNFHSGSTADFRASTNQLAPGISVPTSFPTTGDARSTFNQTTSESSTYGWYVEPRLNISSRFFAAPGFRLDGGSASGTSGGFLGGGLTGLPKIDFSWIAVDQDNPYGFLTLLRPRVAFGYAGTQPGPTQKLRLINGLVGGSESSIVSLNDTTTVPVAFVTTLGNTQLRPERSSELEGGFDAELWHGRLTLAYTQYNKTRHNAIVSVPVAPSAVPSRVNSGVYLNIGEVRNTGIELSMTAQILQSRAVSWTVSGNLSNNNNKVVHLNDGLSQIPLGSNEFIKPGYPLFSQWARPIASFIDANVDGIIEDEEIRYGDSLAYVGQVEPKYQLNIGTDVTMLDGRLSAHATFAYQNGMTQTNYGGFQSGAFTSLLNAPVVPFATQAAILAAACAYNTLGLSCGGSGSLIGVIQTVSTFRFNSLSINYTLPPPITHWFRVPHMALSLQGENLGLHTNYRGKDPNVNAFATVGAGDETADLGQIPQPRTWWLKLSLGN
jgi:TonB-dependent SusC/RagA subfamily outer membrane receptor